MLVFVEIAFLILSVRRFFRSVRQTATQDVPAVDAACGFGFFVMRHRRAIHPFRADIQTTRASAGGVQSQREASWSMQIGGERRKKNRAQVGMKLRWTRS
ncbi:hypothetical protein BSZ21_04670 [Bradyrhizobium canariense]|nr:hypothetical protein BSZ21_04670 [Bradyrhizobium canariense]